MKPVGFRSKILSNSARSQLRKSQSMRNGSTFKPNNPVSTPNNPYAQPIRALRSNSTASGNRERRKKLPISKSAQNMTMIASGAPGNPPNIPDPDYSCSDSENEDKHSLASRLSNVQLQPVENSGNSNARYIKYTNCLIFYLLIIFILMGNSGSSSSSSGSAPPSFSVEEIQKGRSMLKSSKSYPDDFLKKVNEADAAHLEDGDNSSSGVSSDQEITTGNNSEYGERIDHHNNIHHLHISPSIKQRQQQIGGKLLILIDIIIVSVVIFLLFL